MSWRVIRSRCLRAPTPYGSIIRDLLRTVRQLDAAAPTRLSARASQAYVAIVDAIEAAAREQVDVAALFASEPADALAASSATRWSGLEAAQLDVFRDNATGPLAADLEAVLFSPSGITVTAVRDALANRAVDALREPSLAGWVDASGTRIASLRDLQDGARKNLAATASMTCRGAHTQPARRRHLACGPSHRDGAGAGTAPIDHQPIA